MDYWSPSFSDDEEFKKLVLRMNPPRVTVDNKSDKKTTLIKVDSANKRGSLLEVVQVLSDFNLIIRRAYISSDGEWFMDVFHVTDRFGKKLSGDNVANRIQQALGQRGLSFRSLERPVGVQSVAEHTTIELTADLADHKCNVVAAEVWTHNSRMASVVYITDKESRLARTDPDRVDNIRKLMLYVLKGDTDWWDTNTAVSVGSTHTGRRLHQVMYADRDFDEDSTDCVLVDRKRPLVTVEKYKNKGYTVVTLKCPDRPKLLFDAVCTLTDMQFVVYHATIIAEGPEAYQEYYIRHMDGCPISSEAERQRVIHCLEAAIKRRTLTGIRLELCGDDRIGLLADVTRIFREYGLSISRAEVMTTGTQAVNAFYVTDTSGDPVKAETIEAIRKEIGVPILQVTDDLYSNLPKQQPAKFSLGSILRSRSEKFLYNLGLTKSYS